MQPGHLPNPPACGAIYKGAFMAKREPLLIPSISQNVWPWLTIGVTVGLAVLLLQSQGRSWLCTCGYVLLWAGDIWSSDNSQHLFDPYSFTHVLHGVVFYALLAWSLPRLTANWRLAIALAIEAGWEVVENAEFIIQRYRETTLALGYNGDTIINSLTDILLCAVGFWLAQQLGFRRSAILFVATELVLIFWIRDSLLLNVLMLIYPIEAIKAWQMGAM